jgi:hypothetical protein
MRPQPYSGAQIRASLVAYSIGKAISAPLSLLLILLLASVMQRSEYAGYIAATAVLEICVVLGCFGVEWVMQTALAAIRVHGNGLQLRRAVFRLGAVPFLTYGLLGTALWVQAPLVSELLGGAQIYLKHGKQFFERLILNSVCENDIDVKISLLPLCIPKIQVCPSPPNNPPRNSLIIGLGQLGSNKNSGKRAG